MPHAKFEYGGCFQKQTRSSRNAEQGQGTACGTRRRTDGGTRCLYGAQFAHFAPALLRRFHCSHEIWKVAAARLEQCGSGVRSQRACRGTRDSPGHQAAQAAFPCGIHALHHLRTLSHVHEHRALSGPRSRSLRRHYRGCKQALQPDSDSRNRGCCARGYEVCCKWPGAARPVLRHLYRSTDAKGSPPMEHTETKIAVCNRC